MPTQGFRFIDDSGDQNSSRRYEAGRATYIEYEGVRYYHDVLRRSPDLIGQKLTLYVDPEDLRCITAYLSKGEEFGVLTAHGHWGRTPHSLEVRKSINKLRCRRDIFFSETDDPIQVYMAYLAEKVLNRNALEESLRRFSNRQKKRNHVLSPS